MQKIINPEIESYNALELADTVESILSHLDSLDINDLISDQKNRQKLRPAPLAKRTLPNPNRMRGRSSVFL